MVTRDEERVDCPFIEKHPREKKDADSLEQVASQLYTSEKSLVDCVCCENGVSFRLPCPNTCARTREAYLDVENQSLNDKNERFFLTTVEAANIHEIIKNAVFHLPFIRLKHSLHLLY